MTSPFPFITAVFFVQSKRWLHLGTNSSAFVSFPSFTHFGCTRPARWLSEPKRCLSTLVCGRSLCAKPRKATGLQPVPNITDLQSLGLRVYFRYQRLHTKSCNHICAWGRSARMPCRQGKRCVFGHARRARPARDMPQKITVFKPVSALAATTPTLAPDLLKKSMAQLLGIREKTGAR